MNGSFEWHLANWMRWCRQRDWMPMGHISQIAVLIKQAKQESQSASDAMMPIFEEPAFAFNRLVTMLPRRLLTVFLLDHLDKGVLGQIVVYTRHADIKYRLAGVSRSTFYEYAKQADSMIKRWML